MYKEYGCNDSLKGCDYKSSPLFLKNIEYSLQRYISLIFFTEHTQFFYRLCRISR